MIGGRRRFQMGHEHHLKRLNDQIERQETGFNSSAYGNDTVRHFASHHRTNHASSVENLRHNEGDNAFQNTME